jgi:flagellar hook-associated protein 3 FlgL
MAIDRIGTASNAQLLLSQIQKAEVALDTVNRQVTTGKVSDNYAGYGDRTAIMESARSAAARADANISTAQQAATRLDLQDAQLSQLSDLADQVRQTLSKAAADQDGTSLTTQMQGFFNQAVEILNAKDVNGYIYAGDNNQVAPVAVTSWNGLAGLGSTAQAFVNGSVRTTVRMGDTQTVQVGLLASDLGHDLFDLFRQFAQFDAGPNGPFDSKTSPAQQSFLESNIQTGIHVSQGVNAQAAQNGIAYKMVQDTVSRLQATSTVHKTFVSNLEDVDITQALSQLNQNQISLQASFQVASTLNRLSLLDYLH